MCVQIAVFAAIPAVVLLCSGSVDSAVALQFSGYGLESSLVWSSYKVLQQFKVANLKSLKFKVNNSKQFNMLCM